MKRSQLLLVATLISGLLFIACSEEISGPAPVEKPADQKILVTDKNHINTYVGTTDTIFIEASLPIEIVEDSSFVWPDLESEGMPPNARYSRFQEKLADSTIVMNYIFVFRMDHCPSNATITFNYPEEDFFDTVTVILKPKPIFLHLWADPNPVYVGDHSPATTAIKAEVTDVYGNQIRTSPWNGPELPVRFDKIEGTEDAILTPRFNNVNGTFVCSLSVFPVSHGEVFSLSARIGNQAIICNSILADTVWITTYW